LVDKVLDYFKEVRNMYAEEDENVLENKYLDWVKQQNSYVYKIIKAKREYVDDDTSDNEEEQKKTTTKSKGELYLGETLKKPILKKKEIEIPKTRNSF
jgi:hypothetical protein